MTTFRHLLATTSLTVQSIIGRILDRGVDNIVDQFLRINDRLEAYVAKVEARQAKLKNTIAGSIDREVAFVTQERDFRARVSAESTRAGEAAERAARVRGRLAALLD